MSEHDQASREMKDAQLDMTSQIGQPGEPHEHQDSLENVHPADAADHLEAMPLEEQVETVGQLDPEDAAEAISEMDTNSRAELVATLEPGQAAQILSEMSYDDAADVLDELSRGVRESLLKRMHKADAAEIAHLMRYDPDTAGGVMNTENVVLDHALTADQAIALLRRDIEDKEIPYYAYIVDEDERLKGVVSLRELLVAKPGVLLRELIGDRSLITVNARTDKEEVARSLSHYNFLALPVVDDAGKFLGVVTHDDVIDIIHEEASEDMLGMVGAGVDETVDTPWLHSVYKRLPWLCVNMFTSLMAAVVVGFFEHSIEKMAILAVLMGIVCNQGGNTGQQSLAVVIRQLVLEAMDEKKSNFAIRRELRIGLLNGLAIGILVSAAVTLVTKNMVLGVVMGCALLMNMTLGATVGASIPLVLRRLGRDPAQASSIFLTACTDTGGFLIFLGLATAFLL
ncbi:magnesium transporter [Megalodesulfovibrio paquesii]